MAVTFDPIFNFFANPILKLFMNRNFSNGKSKSNRKTFTPCRRRERLLEKVDDKLTKEMDIVTVLNKIRQFDSIL